MFTHEFTEKGLLLRGRRVAKTQFSLWSVLPTSIQCVLSVVLFVWVFAVSTFPRENECVEKWQSWEREKKIHYTITTQSSASSLPTLFSPSFVAPTRPAHLFFFALHECFSSFSKQPRTQFAMINSLSMRTEKKCNSDRERVAQGFFSQYPDRTKCPRANVASAQSRSCVQNVRWVDAHGRWTFAYEMKPWEMCESPAYARRWQRERAFFLDSSLRSSSALSLPIKQTHTHDAIFLFFPLFRHHPLEANAVAFVNCLFSSIFKTFLSLAKLFCVTKTFLTGVFCDFRTYQTTEKYAYLAAARENFVRVLDKSSWGFQETLSRQTLKLCENLNSQNSFSPTLDRLLAVSKKMLKYYAKFVPALCVRRGKTVNCLGEGN